MTAGIPSMSGSSTCELRVISALDGVRRRFADMSSGIAAHTRADEQASETRYQTSGHHKRWVSPVCATPDIVTYPFLPNCIDCAPNSTAE